MKKIKTIMSVPFWKKCSKSQQYIQRIDELWFGETTQLTQLTYRQVSNIRRTLVGNWIVDHSDVVGASPVGAAPTTSSFST